MQKQKRCYSRPPARGRSMPSVSEATGQQRRKIRTLGRISPLTPPLLTYLVGSNNLPPTKPIKRIRTTKEVLGAMVDEDRVEVKTPLQQVSTLLAKRKKRISPTSNASSAKEKAITPASVLRRRSQKTSVGLGDLHVGDCN